MDPLSILLASIATVAATEAAQRATRSESREDFEQRKRLATQQFYRAIGGMEIATTLTPLQQMMWDEHGTMVCPHGTDDFQENNLDWHIFRSKGHGEPKEILFDDGEHIGEYAGVPFFECYHYTHKPDGTLVIIHEAWFPPVDAKTEYGT